MKARSVVAALVGMLGSGAAMAMNGSQLLAGCEAMIHVLDTGEAPSSSPVFGAGQCIGLVEGASMIMYYLNDSLPKDVKVCVPEGVTNGQGARVVVKYLKDNPERLHEDATSLMLLAYHKAFSCKKRP
jgi:hypothetical protein